MRGAFTAAACALSVGLLALSQTALAQQKSAKECNNEWTANKAAIQASGKTKRVFVAECRGVAVKPAKPASDVVLVKGQFATETEAKASCPADTVVWVNLRSKVYHAGGSRSYGKTTQGAYMCEQDSVAAGFRAPRAVKRDAA
jgi:hypothetical protein